MSKYTTIFINRFFTLLFVVLGLYSLILASSYLLLIRPEKTISSWEINSLLIDRELALSFVSRLKTSKHINPLNSKAELLLARLYELLNLDEDLSKEKKVHYQDTAHFLYQNLTIKHPKNGLYWAYLARYQSLLGDSKKVVISLESAMTFAPYEFNTQKIIVPLIIKHWGHLSSNIAIRAKALDVLTHTFTHYKLSALTINSTIEFSKPEILDLLELHSGYLRMVKRLRSEHVDN